MSLKLPDQVSSLQDLASLLLEVRQYASWYAHDAILKRADATRVSEPPLLSPVSSALIHDWNVKKGLNSQSLGELITALERFKETASSLTMTLAAPPTSDVKRLLVSWCRENIAPNVLVTFQFNRVLLGGMVVRYGSHIFDWSFRRQILTARDRFPEVLRNV